MYGLKHNIIQSIKSVFLKYPRIEKAILYGSRATGNYRNGSDIDLTLIGKELDSGILIQEDLELDDLLLPYSIDLSILSQIENADLISHIKEEGICFYQINQVDTNDKCFSEKDINISLWKRFIDWITRL